MKRIIILTLALVLVAVLAVGCTNPSKDSGPKNAEAENITTGSTTDKGSNSSNPEETDSSSGEDNSKSVSAAVFKAVLYFHDNEAMNVVREERDMAIEGEEPGTELKAKLYIEELVKGSANGLSTSIPTSTEVRSVVLEKGTLTVDLSQGFEKDHIGGSAGTLMTMSQLVLTLTELEGVNRVSFKVEGRTLEDFKGHIEFNKPFEREEYEQYLKK